ncbi:MAG: hypothetical protein A2Z49_08370 [Chloroflexi bacterium RBG_19FT_COMBO_56_12]|nr:MAG: hypothetical protein A2Z49_08370 [Chloroflexi bacterium RBG_19FT_COMBO_56_12]
MRLVVIIPAFNEAENIVTVISEFVQVLPEATIIVVDDGSVDNTAAIAEKTGAIVIKHPFNLGIGGAVQSGLRVALFLGADYIIRVDGDGQHPPDQIPFLLGMVVNGDADIAIGSRFYFDSTPPPISLPRRIGIFMFCRLTSLFSGYKITDPTSGFMVMTAQVAACLAYNIAQDYPEVDARIILSRFGYRVKEVPTKMRVRQGGVSSITPSRAVYYMFKVTLSVLAARSRKINPIPVTPIFHGRKTVSKTLPFDH